MEVDTIVSAESGSYRVAGKLVDSDTLSIRIINENYTERWASNYSANYISDVTQKAGSFKSISEFWKMIVGAVNDGSEYLTMNILTEDDMRGLSQSGIGTGSDNKLYLLLTASLDGRRFRFPLPVRSAPFTYEEYADTIRLLYEDNRVMQSLTIQADCTQTILSLERKIKKFSVMMNQLREEKDGTIYALKRKIKRLRQRIREMEVSDVQRVGRNKSRQWPNRTT